MDGTQRPNNSGRRFAAPLRSTGGSEVTPPTADAAGPQAASGSPPAARGVAGLLNPQCCLLCAADDNTLYFGGGTPSLLSPEQLSRVKETLDETGWTADADGWPTLGEFTVEVNPDDIARGGREYADGLRRLGVSRISMGVQSFDDTVLKRMGRRHNAVQAIQAYAILREAGFDNISLDFIFGFTDHFDVREWEKQLEALPGGLPEHISCYQLSIEEGSGLEKMIGRGIFAVPADEVCEKQYYDICAALSNLGYEHYEISNWARRVPASVPFPVSPSSLSPQSPYRSRHNSAYWNHTPYIGFGPGAHSLLVLGNGSTDSDACGQAAMMRRWNNPDVKAYIAAAGLLKGVSGTAEDFSSVRGSETLTQEQILEEKIMLGLRTSDGIDEEWLRRNVKGERISEFLDRGFLCRVPGRDEDKSGHPGRIRIPESRWFISDGIIAELL